MRLITIFELATRSDQELQVIYRDVLNELARSKAGSTERHHALASLYVKYSARYALKTISALILRLIFHGDLVCLPAGLRVNSCFRNRYYDGPVAFQQAHNSLNNLQRVTIPCRLS